MNILNIATQSIIVYRNPLEQMFWESDMLGYLIVFILSSIAGLILGTKLFERTKLRNSYWIFLFAGIIAAIIYKLIFAALTYL